MAALVLLVIIRLISEFHSVGFISIPFFPVFFVRVIAYFKTGLREYLYYPIDRAEYQDTTC